MSGPRKTLTQEDVSHLLTNPSAGTRAATAAKVAADFGAGSLSDAERRIAEDIFRLMVRDAEVRVREALAQNLKENPFVPHDVARTLAEDVDSVAVPMLRYSEVLTDDDLLEIIRSQDGGKQVAIAGRRSVSESVSGALVDTNREEVVTTLVANAGAEISENSLGRVVDRFGSNRKVQEAMVGRPKLPVTVAERLVTLVSDEFRTELMRRHDLSAEMAAELLLQSRERAIIGLGAESSDAELEKLVRSLRDNGRLTASIILRALCMGDMRFFEAALAELADVPLMNARQLIHDSGRLGLQALFNRAGLPDNTFPAVKAAVQVSQETEYDGRERDRERYSRRVIERVLTQYGDLGVDMEADDLEYLLAKMQELPSDRVLGD